MSFEIYVTHLYEIVATLLTKIGTEPRILFIFECLTHPTSLNWFLGLVSVVGSAIFGIKAWTQYE